MSTSRTGIGYDVHAFVIGRPLMLGGVTIPYAQGLEGHSDADAVIHAVVDALLGAGALGDIGQHFPSSEARWKDAPSTAFLTYTRALLTDNGWRIGNVDVTIVAERPKMAPYIPAMRATIAEALGVGVDLLSVKATTTDRLGFTGRGEGIAAMAIATIDKL